MYDLPKIVGNVASPWMSMGSDWNVSFATVFGLNCFMWPPFREVMFL